MPAPLILGIAGIATAIAILFILWRRDVAADLRLELSSLTRGRCSLQRRLDAAIELNRTYQRIMDDIQAESMVQTIVDNRSETMRAAHKHAWRSDPERGKA